MKNIIQTLIVLLLTSCGGVNETYSKLEKEFPANKELDGELIDVKSIFIARKSSNSSYRYRGSTQIRLDSKFLEINVDSKGHEKIQIPVDSISGCSKTCFGPNEKYWDAKILLGVQGTYIAFEHDKNILPWCYDSGLPIVSKEDNRNWMDRGGDLPTYENYQQVDREEYERQINKRCSGY